MASTDNRAIRILTALSSLVLASFATMSAADGNDGRLVMDSNMNRFDPNPSRFASPAFQRECGFGAVAIQPGMPLAVTALFDGYDKRVFPEGSEARVWVLDARRMFAAKFRAAKAAGMSVLATTDIIVLPRRMKELYGAEICGSDGRIDFMKPTSGRARRTRSTSRITSETGPATMRETSKAPRPSTPR